MVEKDNRKEYAELLELCLVTRQTSIVASRTDDVTNRAPFLEPNVDAQAKILRSSSLKTENLAESPNAG